MTTMFRMCASCLAAEDQNVNITLAPVDNKHAVTSVQQSSIAVVSVDQSVDKSAQTVSKDSGEQGEHNQARKVSDPPQQKEDSPDVPQQMAPKPTPKQDGPDDDTESTYSKTSVNAKPVKSKRSIALNALLEPDHQMKIRPIFVGLEETLKSHEDETGTIELCRLQSSWNFYAFHRFGDLDQSEEGALKFSIDKYCEAKEIEIEDSAKISTTDFANTLLGGEESKRGFANVRSRIRKQMRQDRESLQKIMQTLDVEARAGSTTSTMTKSEVLSLVMTIQGCNEKKAEVEVSKLLREMRTPGDVNFRDFLAFGFGRKAVSLELIVYDVSPYLNERFKSMLLGDEFKDVYHIGVVCFGHEFWYGGTLYQTRPESLDVGKPVKAVANVNFARSGDSFLSAKNKDAYTIPIGHTMYTMDELLKHIRDTTSRDYYDETFVVTRNDTVNYADALVKFLTGKSIPKAIFQALQVPNPPFLLRLFGPAVNVLMGGFGTRVGQIFHKEERETLTDAEHVRRTHEESLSAAIKLEQADFAEKLLECKAGGGGYDAKAGATALGISDVSMEGNPIMLKEKQMISDIRLTSLTVIPVKLYEKGDPIAARASPDPVLAQVAACYEKDGAVMMDLRWIDGVRGLLSKGNIPKQRVQRAVAKRLSSDDDHLWDKTNLGIMSLIYDNKVLPVSDQQVQDYIAKFKAARRS